MPRKRGLSPNHHWSQMRRKVRLVSHSGGSIKHCHSALALRCEITAEWEESLSERLFFFLFPLHPYESFGCQLHTPRCACTQAPFQSVHCENRRVPASLNSSHRQHSCDCQFHAWLVVITLRETKNGEGGMHFRIKIESETSLKSQIWSLQGWMKKEIFFLFYFFACIDSIYSRLPHFLEWCLYWFNSFWLLR